MFTQQLPGQQTVPHHAKDSFGGVHQIALLVQIVDVPVSRTGLIQPVIAFVNNDKKLLCFVLDSILAKTLYKNTDKLEPVVFCVQVDIGGSG